MTLISQVDSNSLQAIFNKNPEEQTDEEVDKIVAYLRKERTEWKFDEGTKKAKAKTAAPDDLKLDDLGL